MAFLARFDDRHLPQFGKNANRFLIWGIVLLILGCLAISAATFTTLVTVVFLGFIIFLSGATMAIDTLTFWWNKWGGFFIHGIIAILYMLVGLMLILNPIEGSISLTFLLGVFYIIAGIFRLFFSFALRLPHWGWGFFNGLVSLLLGVLILLNWPEASLFIIGLFVGIDLVVSGIAYIMASLAAKRFA